jgi:hypothetical protein
VRRVLLLAALAAALSAPGAAGGTESARRRLSELKALCDAGLVAPAVCLEKQRVILGLPAEGGAADAPGAPAEAPTLHESPLGFRVALPRGWKALDPGEVRAGLDLLRSRTDGNAQAARVLDRLRADQARGRSEVFAKGRDTLQMSRTALQPPVDAVARARLCERLAATTSKAAARRLRTHACGSRPVGGATAFYTERDALLPGARTIQYWLPDPQGTSLQIVMTCADADADERRREIEGMLETLRWE